MPTRALEPASRYLRCEGRELHYTEWSPPDARDAEVVIAWHGFARCGRDLDDVASHLARRYRVLCPDALGHGMSQWSAAPAHEYGIAHQVELAVSLVAQLGLRRFHWLGTGLGGAVGILAAATALKGPMQRLVINDMGPQPGAEALARMGEAAATPPAFDRVVELESHFRALHAADGPRTAGQWRRRTEALLRRLPDGRFTVHHDPAIAASMPAAGAAELWPAWDSLELPVLCLRGGDSDVLLPEVAALMRKRGPHAAVVEIPGCGHAPALNTPEQFALVDRFLAGDARNGAMARAACMPGILR